MHRNTSPPCRGDHRVFLFLQGPHGPFFDGLGRSLSRQGAQVWRIGFNSGDAAFWRARGNYIAFRQSRNVWPAFLRDVIAAKRVTDIALYGDTRWMHVEAKIAAEALGLTCHVFEEGYLRPYWISYERGGSNGASALMSMDIASMRPAHDATQGDKPVPPGHWGDTRQHIFYGALYHGCVLFANGRYPAFKPHRTLNVRQEFKLYLARLCLIPFHALERWRATRRVERGGFPYHLVLLQLDHDASFRDHGPFRTQSDFLDCVIQAFAEGAPARHHLVFKAHPLEDGRVPLKREIARLAEAWSIGTRVHFVRGGKLARLLDGALSAVTVNSTAGQQALWRGIPLRALGTAVYGKPQLVSDQPLAAFFAAPKPPDREAYVTFRDYLLRTSQFPGSYYARPGRRQAIGQLVGAMLAASGPYPRPAPLSAALRQQLHLVD